MSDIILSIKPQFTKHIFLGNKHVELRKKIGNSFSTGKKLYIYSSSPEKAVVGKAIISKIEYLSIESIVEKHLLEACVNESFTRKYYENHTHGYLIWLKEIVQFDEPIELSELRKYDFIPPQSFCYAREHVANTLRKAK